MPLELFYLECITIIIAGLLFGSYAGALVYRLPRDIPIAFDKNKKPSRSACTHCGYVLGFWDLIPVFSWLLLKGKCRKCDAKISFVYPAVELTTMLGFLAIYLYAGFTWIALPLYLLVPCLTALLFIDLKYYILPNELVTGVALLGAVNLIIVYQGYDVSFHTMSPAEMITVEYLLGGVILYGAFAWILSITMEKLLKKEALGFGDVKFFAAAGLWLGLKNLSFFMIGAGIFGVLFALLWRFLGKGEVFPFGPALIITFFILLLIDGSHLL